MSWLSSIIGSFTGSSKKKGIKNAAAAQTAANNAAISGLQTANTTANTGLTDAANASAAGLTNANAAAATGQNDAAQSAIAQIMQQLGITQGTLSPYESAGASAVGQQGDLLGLNGGDKQGAAITALQNSPLFQSLIHAGNQNILQNASATGGLRGGNTQHSLAQFGTDTLAELIQQHLADLTGVAGQGQSAAVNSGNFGANAATAEGQIGTGTAANIASEGLNTAGLIGSEGIGVAGQMGANNLGTASNIGGLLTNNGAIQAGSILGRTAVNSDVAGSLTKLLSQLFASPGGSGSGGNVGSILSSRGGGSSGFSAGGGYF